MTGRCSIHQPNFFARLSTVAKLASTSTWVTLSNVQANFRDFQNRAMVADFRDESAQAWISLSVSRDTGRSTLLADATLMDPRADLVRAERTITHRYRQSPFWSEVAPGLLDLLTSMQGEVSLARVSTQTTRFLLDAASWNGNVLDDASFDVRGLDRSERLAEICAKVGASTYVSGLGGASYLDSRPFDRRSVTTVVFDPGEPWRQSRLSGLDTLFRLGPAKFASLIRRFGAAA